MRLMAKSVRVDRYSIYEKNIFLLTACKLMFSVIVTYTVLKSMTPFGVLHTYSTQAFKDRTSDHSPSQTEEVDWNDP